MRGTASSVGLLVAAFCLSKSDALHVRAPVLHRQQLSPQLTRYAPVRAPAPATMSLLPTCAATGVWALAAKAGCVGVLAQCGLTALFKSSKDPVLNTAAGYTAHQVVAFALMIFVSAFGLMGWLNPPAVAATAAGRLLGVSESARWLGAMLLGLLLAWDIPTCLMVPRLRKPDALIHHVAMAATALVGSIFLPTHYGFYYMGVIELSSIPLTLYDLCERLAEIAGKDETVPKAKGSALRALRDNSRAVAAVCFVLVRAFDFTRVTLTRFVPDALSVLGSGAAAVRWPIQFMLVSSVGFVVLQLYWFSLFVRVSLAEKAKAAKREKRRASKESKSATTDESGPTPEAA